MAIDNKDDKAPEKKTGQNVTSKEAPKVKSTDKPKSRPKTKSKGALLLPLVILAALGGGLIGGFAAYKFLPAPQPDAPDLSAIDARIEGLQNKFEKDLSAQAAQNGKLRSELSKLDSKWQDDLARLEASVADLSLGGALGESGDISPDAIAAREGLTASVQQLRDGVDDDVKSLQKRLKKLEQQMPAAHGSDSHGSDGAGLPRAPFPKQDILEALDMAAPDEQPKKWWGRFVKRHVSVKRTDRVKTEALLRQMDTAYAARDWDALDSHAQRLPEPGRSKAQEWIAATRP